VPAVARAVVLLELFLDGNRSLSVPEMVVRLGLPRSTTHELVSTLVSKGLLAPVQGQPGRFTLGLRIFELGGAYLAGLDLARQGAEVAEAVVAECDETTQIAVLDGCQAVYIAKVDSTRHLRLVSAVGRRLPAHLTAVGKILLSSLSDEEVVDRYGGSATLPGMTRNSITSMARLLEELAPVRARGLAFDDCESNADVRCVAAPVLDREGAVVAGISISAPITRAGEDRLAQLAKLVQRGAIDLSGRLGYPYYRLGKTLTEGVSPSSTRIV
jgi:IclR family transcriptional regulator, KDG regulon repressor